MQPAISLKSDFELPADHQRFELPVGSVNIIAETECLCDAFNLCHDLKVTMEYGAFPAAHAALIEKINDANQRGIPVACTLAYSAP